jgi:hypothetical protein
MNARALFQGPQGSGKTWTMLSIARHCSPPPARIIVIDTERESALTYADVFTFEHLPWAAPYDPTELRETLETLGRGLSADDVVIIDSASHFWNKAGGILDIANGRVQGGWDKARPIQNALVEQFLAMPCHLFLGARMKNTVLVSDNGKTIENVGLTIVQDDDLGYELNIVCQLDMQHNITVMKSRTTAVAVGRMYPGGMEAKLADDYTKWLAGGIPPANRADVEAILAIFGGIADRDARKALKDGFITEFGMPHSLTAEQVPAARAWLAEHYPAAESATGPVDAQEAADDTDAAPVPDGAGDGDEATNPVDETPTAVDDPTPAAEVPSAAVDAARVVAEQQAVIDAVKAMAKRARVEMLAARELATSGNMDTLGQRLAMALLAEHWTPGTPEGPNDG